MVIHAEATFLDDVNTHALCQDLETKLSSLVTIQAILRIELERRTLSDVDWGWKRFGKLKV